ncbi:MAG TPA: RidA family protein [Nonomuraea sp.]|nr:RidA family protein [Nonomuraea sp.]
MAKAQAVQPSNVPTGGSRPYSLGVRHGNLLYVAGQVGQDFATGKAVSDTDFSAQVRQAMENLKSILEAGGSSMDKVLTVNCYITDIARWAEMNEIYNRYFTSDPKPARATVQAGLVPPHMFEIQAIAYTDE